VRILQLADHMGYRGTVPHGMTTYLLMVLPRVRAAGHEVAACFLREPHTSAQELERAGIPTHFLNARRYDPTIPLQVARVIADFKPDLVHATQVQAVAVARMLRGFGARYALLLHMHNLDVLSAPLRWLNGRLPQPDLALSVSKAAVGPAVSQFRLAPERVRVFYNAFDARRFAELAPEAPLRIRRELGLTEATPVVGRAARFYPDKANDRLVRAMPEILRRVPEAHAILAGDGSERAACEALARQLGVQDRTHFLGHRTDVAAITAACNVMTVTSPADTYPYTALESYAVSKPVIGYNDGGMPEMVEHGVTGFLAQPDDHAAFAGYIVQCLLDPALTARLGAAGREFVKRFSIEGHVSELLGIYEQVLAAHRSASLPGRAR